MPVLWSDPLPEPLRLRSLFELTCRNRFHSPDRISGVKLQPIAVVCKEKARNHPSSSLCCRPRNHDSEQIHRHTRASAKNRKFGLGRVAVSKQSDVSEASSDTLRNHRNGLGRWCCSDQRAIDRPGLCLARRVTEPQFCNPTSATMSGRSTLACRLQRYRRLCLSSQAENKERTSPAMRSRLPASSFNTAVAV
jgi:hypothetical protein